MSNEIWTLDDLKGRIASFYNEKKASEKSASHDNTVPENDPQEESAPGVVQHDGDSAEKTGLPSAGLSTQNRDGIAENNIPGTGDKGEASGKAPNGAGEGGHDAADGDSKDKAVTSPTDPNVAKTASKAKQLADAIKDKLLGGAKRATTPIAKQGEQKVAEQEVSAEQIAADLDEAGNAYYKIANLVMQHEEGRQLVNNLADREFGREAAENLIKEAEEIEYMEQVYAHEQAQGEQMAHELLKDASDGDLKDIEKMMIAHNQNLSQFQSQPEVEAYELGCKQAAMAMDGGGEMPMGPEGMEGGMPPGEEGGEGGGMEDISLEEVAQIIMQMVESGELDPQMAEAILQELAGQDGGGMEGGMEGGMPPGAEGGMPPGMEGGMPPEEAAKMASVNALVAQAFEGEQV